MDVIELPLGQIIPYARNPRRNDKAVAAVAASIAEFGWRQPIVVNENMVVLAGHTRLEAARQLGLETAPVHVAKGLTEAQARAFRIMDNRSAQNAEWDEDLLGLELGDLLEAEFDLGLTGFTDDELNALMSGLAEDGTGPQEGEDEVPEAPDDPVSRPGDLWVLGNHRLLCGDSTAATDVERVLNGVAARPASVMCSRIAQPSSSLRQMRFRAGSAFARWSVTVSAISPRFMSAPITFCAAPPRRLPGSGRTLRSDVQKDRIEVDVWAWGRGLESWLVDHVVIEGGPAAPEAWARLSELLGRTWMHSSGQPMTIARLAIDTGYETAAVYGWARQVGFAQVAPVKGVEGFNRASPVSGPTFVDATIAGKRLRRGARLWTVAVSTFKAETYRFLRQERPTVEESAAGAVHPPGTVHLPGWVDSEWLKQLVAEQLVTVRNKRGFAKLEARIWSETTRLDLRVAEVPTPRPGDRIEIDGEAFLIQGEPIRDRERLVWTVDLRPA